jgi:hypothetical protein
MSSVYYVNHVTYSMVSRVVKQRTHSRLERRPSWMEGAARDFRKGSHRSAEDAWRYSQRFQKRQPSKRGGCLALQPLHNAPVKASAILSLVLVFAKSVLVRTDAIRVQKLKLASAPTQEFVILWNLLLLLLRCLFRFLLPFPILVLLLENVRFLFLLLPFALRRSKRPRPQGQVE